MDMLKVSASGLKAKLGKYMRAVRAGQQVLITDRNEPVARLIPTRTEPSTVTRLAVAIPRKASAPRLGSLRVLGVRLEKGPDSLSLLRGERDSR